VAGEVRRAAVRRAPELGYRDGLPLRAPLGNEGADVIAELRGVLFRPIGGVSRDDVERRPVDAFERE